MRLSTLRNWTLFKSHFCLLLYFPLCYVLWSVADWQVWAFTLIKVTGSFKTAKFTSKVDVCQNDTHTHRQLLRHSRSVFCFSTSLTVLFLSFTLKLKLLRWSWHHKLNLSTNADLVIVCYWLVVVLKPKGEAAHPKERSKGWISVKSFLFKQINRHVFLLVLAMFLC